MGDYLSPGEMIRIAGMFGEVYDDIVQEQRERMLGLAEQFAWPDEVATIIDNIEGYNVGVLEERLAAAARDDAWDGLIEASARYLACALKC